MTSNKYNIDIYKIKVANITIVRLLTVNEHKEITHTKFRIRKIFQLMSHSQRMSENLEVVSAEFCRDQTRCCVLSNNLKLF